MAEEKKGESSIGTQAALISCLLGSHFSLLTPALTPRILAFASSGVRR
jgi:hypothetical protein